MINSNYTLLGLQTGTTRKVLIQRHLVPTAIFKTKVLGPVLVERLGLVGDEQADPTVHGGLDKAVYAYPSEHYGFWRRARADAGVSGFDSDLTWGAMGENLSLQGLSEADVWVGDVLQFANCSLRVTQPREPCFKFNAAMGFNQAVKQMVQSGHCGFYLAVNQTGSIQAGEQFTLQAGARKISITEAFQFKMFG